MKNGIITFLSVLVAASVGAYSGYSNGLTAQLKDRCLVYREDVAALTNERLDTRIETLQDALEMAITVRMLRPMAERDRLEAERAYLEQQLEDAPEHAPIP